MPTLKAQDFRFLNHTFQTHGFVSQGYVYTSGNNWLTMRSDGDGSFGDTEMALNISTQVTDNFRMGAQVYDRNLGQLGQYHPSLDWAMADYRFKSWFGIRGGKVKTVLGLFNDTQDLDFLRPFALLPQSVYPTDLRDTTIAHVGGDIYGTIALKQQLGDLSYTAYAGHRRDSIYSGYPYLLSQYAISFKNYGGLQYGGDLRWNTPLRGLLVGASRIDEDITANGSAVNPLDAGAGRAPFTESSRADWTNQFYGEYTYGKLRVDSEYRRYLRDQWFFGISSENVSDIRGWYISGAYRIDKRLQLGAYYSHYAVTSLIGGAVASTYVNQTDTSLPANHINDKVITGRLDLKTWWNVKVEGHFMNGYGASTYPDGFYPQVNPMGFKPNTNALVIKTGINF